MPTDIELNPAVIHTVLPSTSKDSLQSEDIAETTLACVTMETENENLTDNQAVPLSPRPGCSKSTQRDSNPFVCISPTTSTGVTTAVVEPAAKNNKPSDFPCASTTDIMPIPRVKQGQIRVSNRKREKTAILTESPYRTELQESIEKAKTAKVAKEKHKKSCLHSSLSRLIKGRKEKV